jgi:glycerate kinase
MHILIAPNAFKNSLDASKVAKAIEEGLFNSKLVCTCECFPIADGGDGTAALIVKYCNGTIVQAEVHDALGRKIHSSFGLINEGTTAVIEMADASGLRLLQNHELNPLRASSSGTGELINFALDKGVTKIIIAMGGSATVDGGTGILSALGVRFLDINQRLLLNMPESLIELNSIDISKIDKRILNCELTILCDVDNGLLGIHGAAAVFGPQKGASAEGVNKLEESLTKLRQVVFEQTGKDMDGIKYGGSAGGAAAGLYALLNAQLINGIDHFLQLTNFDEALKRCKIVITGEGCIDEQTLQGKGPFGVAYKAKEKGIPVIGIAGKVPIRQNNELDKYFDVLLSIEHEPLDMETAIQLTEDNLRRVGRQIGNLLYMQT